MHGATPVEIARRQRRWRQVDLAKIAGLSRSTVAQTERGLIPSRDTQAKLSAALAMDEADLFPGEYARVV